MQSTLNSGRVISRFEKLINNLDKIIEEFKELDRQMKSFKQFCDGKKITGTTLSTIGACAGVAALLVAPVAIPFVGGFAALSTIGGMTTNIITGQVDEGKTKDCKEKMKNLITRFQEDYEAFKVFARFLAEQIFILANESQCSFEAAMAVIMAKSGNLATIKNQLDNSEEMSRLDMMVLGKYAFLPVFLMAMLEDSKIAVGMCEAVLKISCPLPVQCTNLVSACKIGGKMFARSVVVVNVILQIAEISATIDNATKNHVTCDEIAKILEKLNSIKDNYESILTEMKLVRDSQLTLGVSSNMMM